MLYNRDRIAERGQIKMKEKELFVCIWIHHIATFAGISEGIYYLMSGKRRIWRNGVIFLLTAFQSWAGFKILTDIKKGKSRLADSYTDLKGLSGNKRKIILGTVMLLSTMFKIFPVHILGRAS